MSLSIRVDSQVPEFVREDHPAFLEFLKAYYAWLNNVYSIGKLEDIVDIDSTVDSFLQYFKQEIDINGVLKNVDNRMYLRHIKEMYSSKGSVAAYAFLFRIIFGQAESTTIQPWDYVFIPSNGKWKQDISVILRMDRGEAYSLVDHTVLITDNTGSVYRTFVNAVSPRPNGTVELFVDRFAYQHNLINVTSIDLSIKGTILSTTATAKVEKSGSGFNVGQLYRVKSHTDSGSDTIIKVVDVDDQGGVKAVKIIEFGTEYNIDFNLLISPTGNFDPATLGSRITLGGTTYKSSDNANAQNESGVIVRHDYTDMNAGFFVDPTYVGQVLAEMRSQPLTRYVDDSYASIKFTSGKVCVYPGYYPSSENILGDLVYIEDSYYYQRFSYVTSLDATLDSYSDILKKTLHPAGTKHFANYVITNETQNDMSVDMKLNLIIKTDTLRDLILTAESMVFDVSKLLNDNATPTDLWDRVATYNRAYADSTITAHTDWRDIMPVWNDSTTGSTDLYDRIVDYVRQYNDVAATSETKTFAVDKILADYTATIDVYDRTAVFNRDFADVALMSHTDWRDISPVWNDTTTISELYDRVVNYDRGYTETATTSDVKIISVNKSLTDTTNTIDVFDRVVVFKPQYNEIVLTTDAAPYFDQITLYNDVFYATDIISVEPGFLFADLISISSTTTLQTDKYQSDAVQTSSTGSIYGGPYYFEITLPVSPSNIYWEPGYLQNELLITN